MAKKRSSWRHQAPRLQNKRQRVETDKFVLPDDITELCQFLDDGDGVELPSAEERQEEVWRRKNEQIRQLKGEKRALKKDLKRSRQVGSELEADLHRLQRQRHKELSDARCAERNLRALEEKVADRDQTCSSLQEEILRLKTKLTEEICAAELCEVSAVVQSLVESVELSVRADVSIDKMQQEVTWLKFQEQDLKDYCHSLAREWRETEEFAAVEQKLSDERVEQLTAELEASRLRLQEEQRACAELGTTCALQLGELACKTTWLESVTLVNVTLKSRLSAKIEEINELEAERDDWQQQASQLQREREEFQAEQAKQQQECLKLQKELRSAQLGELKSQQQLRIAQMTAKQAQCEQERLQMKLNAVEADTDVATFKENLLPQLNVPFTPKQHDVGRLATLRNTKRSL